MRNNKRRWILLLVLLLIVSAVITFELSYCSGNMRLYHISHQWLYSCKIKLQSVLSTTYDTKSEAEEECVEKKNAVIIYSNNDICILVSEDNTEVYYVTETGRNRWKILNETQFIYTHDGATFFSPTFVTLRQLEKSWIVKIVFFDGGDHFVKAAGEEVKEIEYDNHGYYDLQYYIVQFEKNIQSYVIELDSSIILLDEKGWSVRSGN